MLNSSKCGFYHCFGAHSLARQKTEKTLQFWFNVDFNVYRLHSMYCQCVNCNKSVQTLKD